MNCKHRSTRLSWLMLLGMVGVLTSGQVACAESKASEKSSAPQLQSRTANTMELANLQDRFGEVANRVTPSIVAISAVPSEAAASAALMLGNVDGPQLAAALDRVSRTVGTGFIIDADGYIVTAEHVVADAEQLWITTDDQKVYPAMVVGSDPRSDLAVLKIPAHGLRPVEFRSVDAIKRGQWAFTMGNPYGLATGGELAMSIGVVAATNRSLPRLSAQENRLYTNLIQTTAEINPGNSGGPLFDLEGRVIGVNAAVVLPQKNTNGIGFSFAITDELLGKVKRLKVGEPVQHAYLGVSVSTAAVKGVNGARIDSVLADGPSGKCGLAVGDVVIGIDDTQVISSDTFARTVSSLPITKPATLRLVRGDDTKTISVVPDLRPASRTAISRANQRLYWGGIVLSPRTDGPGYTVKSVATSSPLCKRGVQAGTIVTGVSGQKAATLADMLTMLGGIDPDKCQLDCMASASAAPVIKTASN